MKTTFRFYILDAFIKTFGFAVFVLLTFGLVYVCSFGATESEIQAAIKNGIAKGETSIDVSSLQADPQQVVDTFKQMYISDPCMYVVDGSVSCKYVNEYASSIEVKYIVSTASEQGYDTIVSDIASKATGSDVDKVKFVHDYLIENFKASSTGSSSYDLLVKGSGRCSAYAMAYKEILNELGIECVTATSEKMAHQWNMVKLNGNWYHVDVYWDKNYSDQMGQTRRDNFLKSDACITILEHSDWQSEGNVKATDTTYDFEF